MFATASILGLLERRAIAAPLEAVAGVDDGRSWSQTPRTGGRDDAWRARPVRREVHRGVARIEGGYASGFGEVYDSSGRRLENISHKQRLRRHAWWKETTKHNRRFLTLPQRIDEPVLVLTASTSAMYFHWIVDVLPRYFIAREAGLSDRAVYAPRNTRFQRETLDALGLGGRVIDANETLLIQCGDLAVPAHQLGFGHLPPAWAVRFLREELFPRLREKRSRFGKRIYVSRRDARRGLENEGEVLAALEPLGFQCVTPGELSVAEQMTAFASAEVVVGAHGSALANTLFCRPGTVFVELFSNDYVDDSVYRLSQAVGLEYYYVVERNRGIVGKPIERNFELDPADLLATLDLRSGGR